MLYFVAIFSARSETNIGAAAAGLPCQSDAAVVVKLEEKGHHLTVQYLKTKRHMEADAKQAVCCRKFRCWIVDARNRHEELQQLIAKCESWFELRWTATQVESGLPVERYRQYARKQNMQHTPSIYI